MAVDKLVDSAKLDAAIGATADAIREKTGDADEIAFDLDGMTGFAAEVAAIPEGTDPVIESLSVTENGTYTAPTGVDGYSPVTVNVTSAVPVITPLTATANGTYTAPEGTDGYSPVTVNVYSDFKGIQFLAYNTTDQTNRYVPSVIDLRNIAPVYREYHFNHLCYNAGVLGNSGLYVYLEEVYMPLYDYTFGGLDYTFTNCNALKYIHYPANRFNANIGVSCFEHCSKLKAMCLNPTRDDLKIGNTAFKNATDFETLIILSTHTLGLQGTTVFTGTKISNGTGYVYVPDSMVETYQAATNWSSISAQIKGHSDLPAYDAATSYIWDDFVKHGGKIYRNISKEAITGQSPSGTTADTDYWQYCGEVLTNA